MLLQDLKIADRNADEPLQDKAVVAVQLAVAIPVPVRAERIAAAVEEASSPETVAAEATIDCGCG